MAKNKGMTITIMPDEIVGSEIIKSGDYKYASIGVKMGDQEFMRISYEWKGEGVPEFVMAIMSWMQANKEVIDPLKEERAEEYAALKERM
ncbi:hypothetical protein LCGC14_1170870 [marine sediment metagenome]|uniref:Uncharacterized protein n=1 Tax=marine sediment metagenome TaxID=412755 RepID=A0A0F9LPV1_9ZZZZ